MTTLIELHDHNIRISSPQGLLGESPGFANIAEKPPVFGTKALGLTRLHPQESYNQFWFQLGLDPLVTKNKLFRHQADLAYAHLNTITEQLALHGDTIFVVPSHYSGSQLATLLGLVQHCSIDAKGLVDLSLLALAKLHEHEHALFMDVQLHQTVLTLVTKEQGEIVREKVLPIPGTGLLALHDAWANAITDAFIKQSRFDPLHNADTEQYIYNEIENWLQLVASNKEILLEINNKGAIHQATLTLKNFEQRVQSIYSRITQELDSLSPGNTPVYALQHIASLPGLQQAIAFLIPVPDDAITENGFEHLELIKRDSDALTLVSRLPVDQNLSAASSSSVEPRPTHFLFQHKAYAISDSNLATLKLNPPLMLELQEAGYCLLYKPEQAIQVNGEPVSDSVIIKIGDRLTINDHTTLEFIQVQ